MFFDSKGNFIESNMIEIMSTFNHCTNIPITLISSDLSEILSVPNYNVIEYPVSTDTSDDYNNIYKHLIENTNPQKGYIHTNNYLMTYIALGLYHNQNFKGSLVAGPFCFTNPSTINFDTLITDNQMPYYIKPDLKTYYNNLVMIKHPRQLSLLKFLVILSSTKVDTTDTSFINDYEVNIQDHLSANIIENRELNPARSPSTLTKDLYHYVGIGDLENAKKTKEKINEYEMITLPGVEGIRNGKNLLIIFSNSMSRVVHSVGVDYEYSSNLHYSYVISIEKCSTMDELIKLSDTMLKDYVTSVNKYSITTLHPAVRKSLKMINDNLSRDITLNEVANTLKLHPNYFSSLFKKEMDVSYQNYVSNLRGQEAKRLLDYSDYSLLDVALHLCFKSQSHFTTTFKKYEGVTPSAYRKQNNT